MKLILHCHCTSRTLGCFPLIPLLHHFPCCTKTRCLFNHPMTTCPFHRFSNCAPVDLLYRTISESLFGLPVLTNGHAVNVVHNSLWHLFRYFPSCHPKRPWLSKDVLLSCVRVFASEPVFLSTIIHVNIQPCPFIQISIKIVILVTFDMTKFHCYWTLPKDTSRSC